MLNSHSFCFLQPNLNELPVKASSSEKKENVSCKRSLSETNSTVDSKGSREGHPATKKTKVVDILLGSNETTDLTKVKVEPFVDGMHCMYVYVCVYHCMYYVHVCVFLSVCPCVCVSSISRLTVVSRAAK